MDGLRTKGTDAMNHPIKLLFALALAVGCDPMTTAAVGGADTKSRATVARAETPKPIAAASVGTFGSLSECLGSCDGADASATDRKTCRLNCETAYGAEARGVANTAANDDPIAQATGCLSRCYGGAGTGESCASACKTTAAAVASPPPTEVLVQLDACVKGCEADTHVRDTDRATCELNCAQVARVEATPPPSATPAPGA
jgi:hypothetical protein